MSEPDFNTACSIVLANEGGSIIARDPADRGIISRFGITLATLSAYRKQAATAQDIAILSETEARAIYKANYWTPLKCDQMGTRAVASAVLDAGVLTGTANAARQIQGAAGVLVDGQIGPKTLAAVTAADPVTLCGAFSVGMQAYVVGIVKRDPTQQVFIVGWLKRMAVLRAMPFLLP